MIPFLSSISFALGDYELNDLAKSSNLIYTRYIDDLTFSGNKYPTFFQKKVNNIVRKYGYLLNHKKSQILYRDNDRQIVTGVCINKKINISKDYKMKIRAELDKYANEVDNSEKIEVKNLPAGSYRLVVDASKIQTSTQNYALATTELMFLKSQSSINSVQKTKLEVNNFAKVMLESIY